MPDLSFAVRGARPVELAISPHIALRLGLTNRPEGDELRAVLLRCQAQVDPLRRGYSVREERRLVRAFGERNQWGQSMRSLPWHQATVSVPAFMDSTEVELLLPCALQLGSAAASYILSLEEGEVPVMLLFSGSVFYVGGGGAMAVEPIPLNREARAGVPIAVLREAAGAALDRALLALPCALFRRLEAYADARSLGSATSALERLLAAAEQVGSPPQRADGGA